MVLKALLEIGLTEREIKVYTALLELGQTTTGPLSKKSEISNNKVYETLEKLMKKGLASYTIISKTKYFQASDPDKLLDIIEEKTNLTKKAIIELKLKQNKSENLQTATIYEGFEGIKTAFSNILNSLKKDDEYLVFTLGDELKRKELDLFFSNYHAKRAKQKIKVRLIANLDLKKLAKPYEKYKGFDIRFTNLNLPTGIFIYEDKVMTLIWKDKPTVFVIQSKNNAESYRNFFEELWKKTKK